MRVPLPDPGLSIFTWKGIDIYHKEGILKIGTDAILLATWVSKMAIAPTRILDVGCGSGVLTILLASHFKKAHTIAIDIQPDAVELTKLNATKAGILNRVRVLPLDILVDRLEEMTGVDLVVSNPPFFYNQLQPHNGERLISKHTGVTPDHWIKAMTQCIDQSGTLCIVVPSDSAFVWIRSANEMGWYCQHRLDVYSFLGDDVPKRTLLQFGTELHKVELQEIHIYASGTQQTQKYQAWLHTAPVRKEKR